MKTLVLVNVKKLNFMFICPNQPKEMIKYKKLLNGPNHVRKKKLDNRG